MAGDWAGACHAALTPFNAMSTALLRLCVSCTGVSLIPGRCRPGSMQTGGPKAAGFVWSVLAVPAGTAHFLVVEVDHAGVKDDHEVVLFLVATLALEQQTEQRDVGQDRHAALNPLVAHGF
jgi:hypothetical protein